MRTLQDLNLQLGYCFPNEITELTRLAQSLPLNSRILNIGAGGGVSAVTFLLARPDLRVTTIDITQESSPHGSLEGELQAIKDCGIDYAGRFLQIHGKSQEIGAGWGDTVLFGLIYIDGGHEYEECRDDIQIWMPYVEKGGYLSIHDYDKGRLTYGLGVGRPHPVVLEGVDQAVREFLLGKYPLESQVDSLITFRIPGGSDEKEN